MQRWGGVPLGARGDPAPPAASISACQVETTASSQLPRGPSRAQFWGPSRLGAVGPVPAKALLELHSPGRRVAFRRGRRSVHRGPSAAVTGCPQPGWRPFPSAAGTLGPHTWCQESSCAWTFRRKCSNPTLLSKSSSHLPDPVPDVTNQTGPLGAVGAARALGSSPPSTGLSLQVSPGSPTSSQPPEGLPQLCPQPEGP